MKYLLETSRTFGKPLTYLLAIRKATLQTSTSWLSIRTVEIYLGKVYDKLDVHSRSQLLLKMRENNLLSINFTADGNMDNDILNLF
ncbi:MAG: hypothetical protein RJA07_2287 [Bacteroidota bacterium]|jgi:hypothetical protein